VKFRNKEQNTLTPPPP